MPTHPDTFRKHLLELLRGGGAHVTFERAVADLPARLRGVAPPGAPHTAWQLLEHLRIAQDDILRFSRNRDGAYASPPWPEGYWPDTPAPPSDRAWDDSVRAYLADRAALEAMVSDPAADLFTPFPWGDGETLAREAMLAADHAAYHLGQLVLLRRLLGAWPGD
jgi:hypothetical protein